VSIVTWCRIHQKQPLHPVYKHTLDSCRVTFSGGALWDLSRRRNSPSVEKIARLLDPRSSDALIIHLNKATTELTLILERVVDITLILHS
jgi:hypothetical protein